MKNIKALLSFSGLVISTVALPVTEALGAVWCGFQQVPEKIKPFPLWLVLLLATTVVPWSAWKGVEFSAWAAGASRYLSTSGSDANSCAASTNIATPKLTFASALSCMAAGDTLYIRTGTYAATIGTLIPGGVSSTVRTVISAYNNETVSVTMGGSTHGIYITNKDNITLHGIDWNRGGGTNTSNAIKLESNVNNVTISGPVPVNGVYKCKVRGAGNVGLNVQGVDTNIHIKYCEITANGQNATVAPYAHGAYFQRVTGLLIEGNYFHGNGCYQFQIYPYTQNAVVRGNRIRNSGTTAVCTSLVNLANSGHLIERNIFEKDSGTGGKALRLQYGNGGAPSNMTIRNNTFYGPFADCVWLSDTNPISTGNLIINNILLGCTSPITNLGTNTDTTNRKTGTASAIFKSVTPGSYDLTIKAGSVTIGAGTATVLPANSTTDQGAHEVPLFSNCEVKVGEPTRVYFRFINNTKPPIQPASGVLGVTFRRNGANNVATSFTRAVDNEYYAVITTSMVGGETIDMSINPATTNLTDTASIGGTANQPFVNTVTNQACTNNLGGAPAHTYTQVAYEHHYYRGPEDAPTVIPYGIADGLNFPNLRIGAGGKVRTDFVIKCGGANCPDAAFHPYVSVAGGSYERILDDFSSHEIKMCGLIEGSDIPENGSPSTNKTATTGTFVVGGIVFTANVIPTIVGLNNGYKTELEYCFAFSPAASGNYDVRLYLEDGTALNAYTFTPRYIVDPPASGGY
jgi:hypothetical protein